MRILGVDPGAAHIGWALIETAKRGPETILAMSVSETEAFFNPKRWTVYLPDSCTLISSLQTLTPDVDAIAIEGMVPFRSQSPAAAAARFRDSLPAGEIIGALKGIALAKSLYCCVAVRPQICAHFCGHASASKRQMQAAVKVRLQLDEVIRPQHVNDAVAVALLAADYYSAAHPSLFRYSPQYAASPIL